MSRVAPSHKAARFTESVIREMTRLAQQHGAVNLSQGFPDFPAPAAIKEAACDAIRADINQYAVTWGTRSLREAIAAQFTRRYGAAGRRRRAGHGLLRLDRDDDGDAAGDVDPGDEVIVFEPFYENYGPDAIVSGATPRFVRLRAPDWSFDPDELAAAFSNRTRAIIINTPNNPTGKVFSREELGVIARLCQQWDVLAVTDEIYEHIVYDGAPARAAGDARRHGRSHGHDQRAVEDVQRHRAGASAGPSRRRRSSGAIRKVHDFLTVGAPAPLQEAGAAALALDDSYYQHLAADYVRRRDLLLGHPRAARLRDVPSGRRVLHHDGHRARSAFQTTSRSRGTWWPTSASPPCPAAASIATRPAAARSCASVLPSATRRWPRPIADWRGWRLRGDSAVAADGLGGGRLVRQRGRSP